MSDAAGNGLATVNKYKVEHKLGVVENEKYRLVWAGGLPSWSALTDFNYFWSKGAVFPVESTYNEQVYPVRELDLPKTDDPLEYMAWRYIRRWTYWVDISSYSEADTRARIDAFIDTLEAVKSGGK